ncbi:MAG: hypothetical protein Q8K82_06095 [Gemmatimonadaceae bacterium]|nr:hypothetical protein [Gemmatimonadaceae bacterium]
MRIPRVVLDHCVPRTLLRHVTVPGATTIGAYGWAGRDDGPLLDLLPAVCDVFVTTDQNLPFQQRLDTRSFATTVLVAPSNRLADLLPLISGLQAAIDEARPGAVVRVAR